jgi:transposase
LAHSTPDVWPQTHLGFLACGVSGVGVAPSPIPGGLRRRVLRVYAHYQFLSEQLAALEAERLALLRTSQEASIEKVRQLMHLKGSGINGAWLLAMEFFGGRALKNRREVGGLAGLTPTPYQTGAFQ